MLRGLLSGQAVTFHGAVLRPGRGAHRPRGAGGCRSSSAAARTPRSGGAGPVWRRLAGHLELAPALRGRRRDGGRGGRPRRAARAAGAGMRCRSGAGSRTPGRRPAPAWPGHGGFLPAPFERFERYCPYGTAADVAGFLAPYVAAGCTEFNLIPQSPDPHQAVAGVAAVRNLLARDRVPSGGPHGFCRTPPLPQPARRRHRPRRQQGRAAGISPLEGTRARSASLDSMRGLQRPARRKHASVPKQQEAWPASCGGCNDDANDHSSRVRPPRPCSLRVSLRSAARLPR